MQQLRVIAVVLALSVCGCGEQVPTEKSLREVAESTVRNMRHGKDDVRVSVSDVTVSKVNDVEHPYRGTVVLSYKTRSPLGLISTKTTTTYKWTGTDWELVL